MNRKSLITISWISFFIGIFIFVFFSKEKTPQMLLLNIFIAGLYTFVFSLGNGFVNETLSKRFSWVNETKERVIFGIIATVLVNVVLVFFCNYVNFIIFQKQDFSGFFEGNMGFNNWFTINVALLISAILHAKSFMEEWKKSTRKEVVEQKLIAK